MHTYLSSANVFGSLAARLARVPCLFTTRRDTGFSDGRMLARAIATNPDVVLMDEPCSALDPIATLRIEELMLELKQSYSIIIVTHNMQQAARVSDKTAFFNVKLDTRGQRTGELVEFTPTDELFTAPKRKETEDYITGRFG